MNIHLSAPLLSKSGYGVHSRQIYLILEKYCMQNNYNLTINSIGWGNTGWYLHEDTLGGLTKRILSNLKSPEVTDLHVIVSIPNEFANSWGVKAKKTIGITAGIEATECSKDWKNFINVPSLNKCIVPSQFAKNTMVNGGCSASKISVVPEAYFEDCLNEPSDFDLKDIPDKNILSVSSVMLDHKMDRKNFRNQILAAEKGLKTFNGEVGLLLKLNSVGRGSVDKYNTIESLKNIIRTLGISIPVTLIHGELEDEKMRDLYKHPKVSAYFSMTRGEGFGLPLLEAAACGLPIIASNWSAHPEFLEDKFIPIEGKEVPIPKEKIDGKIWVGGNWFEPSIDDASSKIVRFFSDEKFRQDAMDNASALQKIVKNRYSLSSIEKELTIIVDGVLKR